MFSILKWKRRNIVLSWTAPYKNIKAKGRNTYPKTYLDTLFFLKSFELLGESGPEFIFFPGKIKFTINLLA